MMQTMKINETNVTVISEISPVGKFYWLTGNTFPVKDVIKSQLGGKLDADTKSWSVLPSKMEAYLAATGQVLAAKNATPTPTASRPRPVAWRINDEITIALTPEGREAVDSCPKGHRVYTVEVYEDASFDSAWQICQTWVACPVDVAPPPLQIVDGTQKKMFAGMLVWAPGWVPPGKDAFSL